MSELCVTPVRCVHFYKGLYARASSRSLCVTAQQPPQQPCSPEGHGRMLAPLRYLKEGRGECWNCVTKVRCVHFREVLYSRASTLSFCVTALQPSSPAALRDVDGCCPSVILMEG